MESLKATVVSMFKTHIKLYLLLLCSESQVYIKASSDFLT